MTTPHPTPHVPGQEPVLEPGPDALPDDVAVDHTLPPAPRDLGAPGADQQGRGEQAKQEAGKVAEEAKAGGQQVAQTAKDELGHVAHTVGEQARTLVDQTRSELTSQAGTQQHRVAEGIRGLGGELQAIAEGSPQQGLALDLARQASDRTQAVASWLDGRDPADLLEEVKGFARRRPGTFIAVAAGIGLLAGRFTRGLTADRSADGAQRGVQGGTLGVAPVQPVFPVAEPVYAERDAYAETVVLDDVEPPLAQDDPFLPGTTGPAPR
jgi:ElaB/YqjD/DUF883 family membrane-anchored ribosome-binding protein